MAHQPSRVHRLHRRSDFSFWLWGVAIAIWWPGHYAAQALRSEILSRPANRCYPSWWWSGRTLRLRPNGSRRCDDVIAGPQTPTRSVGAVWNIVWWVALLSRTIDFFYLWSFALYCRGRTYIYQVTGLKFTDWSIFCWILKILSLHCLILFNNRGVKWRRNKREKV